MSLIKKNEFFLLGELVKKNFISKYKDSVLGILWTILSPLLMMLLFTIIFATLFKRDIANFQIYFLCGWCIFQFFASSVSSSMNSLKGNENILKRTSVSKFVFILASIISEFLNFIIMMLLMVAIMILTQSPFHWTIIFSFIPVVSLSIMLLGIGMLVSIACVYYTDIKHLWTAVSMMLMYASAIFYPIEIIPEPYRSYMYLSPLYWAIDQFRCFIYYGIIPEALNMVNLIIFSLIVFVLGIIVFNKYENTISLKF